MLETSTIAPFVPCRTIRSAVARFDDTQPGIGLRQFVAHEVVEGGETAEGAHVPTLAEEHVPLGGRQPPHRRGLAERAQKHHAVH